MRRESGLTLVELSIVGAVLIPVLLAVLLAGSVTSRAIAANEVRSSVGERARLLMDQVRRQLRGASLSSLLCFDPAAEEAQWVFPQEGVDYHSIRFASLADPEMETLLRLDPPTTFEWQLEAREKMDGIDQDHDGMVDEGHLVLESAKHGRVVLANNLEGFVVKRFQHDLELRLQLAQRQGRKVERASVTQHLRLRNN